MTTDTKVCKVSMITKGTKMVEQYFTRLLRIITRQFEHCELLTALKRNSDVPVK